MDSAADRYEGLYRELTIADELKVKRKQRHAPKNAYIFLPKSHWIWQTPDPQACVEHYMGVHVELRMVGTIPPA